LRKLFGERNLQKQEHKAKSCISPRIHIVFLETNVTDQMDLGRRVKMTLGIGVSIDEG
jgi:hypothetical protein